MDAIDILGSILGQKTSRAGKGTDILKDIFTKSSRRQPESRSSRQSKPPSKRDLESQARELEDMLNVAKNRNTETRSRQPMAPPQSSRGDRWSGNRESESSAPTHASPSQSVSPDQEQAIVLVRAMINAAKSDGQIDETEQQKIIERLGNPTRANIEFLRSEFAKPLNLKEFVWSVPVGMEEQVYTVSLIAVDLDTSREAKYFMDLAQGLRIPADVREQIHQRMGAPSIY